MLCMPGVILTPERLLFCGLFIRCLVKLTNERGDDWDQHLEPILFGIRTSVQESTKFTPFFLMHGREARLPMEAEMSKPTVKPDLDTTIARLRKLKEEVHPTAKHNIENSQHKQKLQYQWRRGLVKSNYKVGDLVLRLSIIKRTKKGHKWRILGWDHTR